MFPTGIPFSKRAFDVIFSLIGLILVSPILMIISILLWLKIGAPIVFRQERPGYLEKPFWIFKFRTMSDKRDKHGNLLPDKYRITSFGKFLRTFSLDELPELINILRGDMSFVGPRPLLMEYLDRYSVSQRRRHEVLPGITGWAQINGRKVQSWEDKFRFDVWYVDNWSLRLDFKIIVITIWKVIKREGISQPGHATAEKFMGNNKID
ncbi:MAG: sugar transferase [Anaerolineales bacterium]